VSRIRQLLSAAFISLLTACGGGGGGGGGSVTTGGNPTPTNVAAITVNGALGFANLPYVTVTVCVPGTSNCVTINNVLVDTGSSGLRVLDSVVAGLALQQRTNANNQLLFECAKFVDDSHAWGPVKIADIKIGSNVASATNIQTIANTAGVSEPGACGLAQDNLTTAKTLGANGILGVGYFVEDCGPRCATVAANQSYYACPGACSDSLAASLLQVQNPVARFAADNNGVIIDLPAVAASGAVSVNGSLIFGIATQANNARGSASKFTLDSLGNISTRFNNTDYAQSFIDSGSNGLFFPNTLSITTCSSSADFYCPASTLSLSAIISGATGSSAQRTINFSVANTEQLNSNFNAFGGLAGRYDLGFDWGLPFFLGRKVYTAFETNSGGPYVAF
jgi:hypothetical protein